MIVDALVIAGPNLFAPGSAPLPDLLAGAARLGIDAMVVAPGRPVTYELRSANDALAAAARPDGRVRRLARVDPWQGGAAVDELRRCLEELGCVGVYLSPGEENFPVRIAAEVARAAESAGVPIVVETGSYARSEPLQVLDLARSAPSVPVVMTAGGQINISGLSMTDAWAALRRADNLHVLTNGEYRQDYLESLVAELGPDRLLFGSGQPTYDQAFELERVRSADLGAAREAVLGGNAARLFGAGAP